MLRDAIERAKPYLPPDRKPFEYCAECMGISYSLLMKGLENREHISWQRIALLPDVVRATLVEIQIERWKLGTIEKRFVLPLPERTSR